MANARRVTIAAQPYGQEVVLYAGGTAADRVAFAITIDDEWEPSCDAVTYNRLEASATVYIILRRKTDIAMLGHELVHAANYILKHCGIRTTADNDEALAYLVGHLMDAALKGLKR